MGFRCLFHAQRLFHAERLGVLGVAGLLIAGCSTHRVQEKVQEKLLPAERGVQPTVSAFECGGGSMKSAIATCRANGGHFGHCAVLASHVSVTNATACFNYASMIHKRREQLVGQEDQLDAEIHYLQDVNTDTATLNAQLSERLEEATARTDTAVESLAQGEITETELGQLRAILDNEVSYAQRQLDVAVFQLQAAQQYRSRQKPPTAAELDSEIARLQASLDEARRQTSALIAQRQRI